MLGYARYGIATPKGSKWRDPISLAILELQEKGTIQMLYNKWWKNTGDVCTRQVRLRVILFIPYGQESVKLMASCHLSFVLDSSCIALS